LLHNLMSSKVLIYVCRIWLNTLISPVLWFHGVSHSLIDLVLHPLSYSRILGDILLVPILDTKYKPTTEHFAPTPPSGLSSAPSKVSPVRCSTGRNVLPSEVCNDPSHDNCWCSWPRPSSLPPCSLSLSIVQTCVQRPRAQVYFARPLELLDHPR
jgi:hypothetical protein